MKYIYINGGVAMVDASDFEYLNQWNWYLDDEGYARRTTKGMFRSNPRMHRVILRPSAHMVVDHKNHNKLDNRRMNLRIVSNAENQNNRKRGDTGVGWHKYNAKWQARIQRNGKRILLGYFNSKDEALAARHAAL